MLEVPTIPTWDAMHPLVIHFPIVLLLLSPLFILISALMPSGKGRPYLIVALVVLLLGTGSLFLAASSGEGAADLADREGGVGAVLAVHESLATKSESAFTGLSLLLVGLFVWPKLSRNGETRINATILPLGYLVLYTVGVLFLVNTAHAGGRLVHEFGVHAMLPQHADQAGSSPTAQGTTEREKTGQD
jgi:uncharacterized membrane protein